MISILNDFTVEDFLNIYDLNLQGALGEFSHYYVEDGLIKFWRVEDGNER